ncbi:MAG TPA: hypothetical protein VGI27_02415, partial [Solirubrobacteraceae bacterium]
HRIGRTGRAGRQGVGITLVSPQDRNEARQIADRLRIEHGLGGGAPHNGANRNGASRNGASRNGRRRDSGRPRKGRPARV